MKTILLTLVLAPSFVFAGPGVSSGDENVKSYTCTLSGVQDSSYVSQFIDIHGAKPSAVLSVGVGEYSLKNLDGICSRVENVDEFHLNCVFVDGFEIYQATLHSEGSPTLISSIKRLDKKSETSKLACYLDVE